MFLSFSSAAWADEYVLVMSKDDNVCQHMLKLYNADLKKYGRVMYEKHEEFNWIKWEKKAIRIRPAFAPSMIEIEPSEIALFDINNDTRDEAIIYSESMLSGHPLDLYEIFRTDDLPMLDDVVDGKIYSSKRQKSFDSNEAPPLNLYEITDSGLRKLPKRMRFFISATKARGDNFGYFVGSSSKINFIKYHDRYYIAFRGPMSLAPGERHDKMGQYSIISELQQDNTFKHQCLYLIKKAKPTNRRTN